jgi:outer membrane protein TolC
MNRFLLLSFFVFYGVSALSQVEPSTTISLKEAIKKAFLSRPEIELKNLDILRSSNDLTKAKNALLPKLNANADIRYNTELQTNILPGAVFGSPVDRKVQFGTPSNTIISADMSMPLFDVTYFSGLKALRSKSNISSLNLLNTKESIITNVVQAYVNASLSIQKRKLADVSFQLADSLYQIEVVKLKNGTSIESNVSNSLLNKENADLNLLAAKHQESLALDDLSLAIIGEPSQKFVPETDLNKILLSVSNESSPSKELLMEQENERYLHFLIQKERDSRLPVLSLYGLLGNQNLSSSFQWFSSQSSWFSYSYIGLKANVPIFDAFSRRSNIKDYQYLAQQSKLNQKIISNNQIKNSNKASKDLEYQKLYLRKSNSTLQLANAMYIQDSIKFMNGTITSIELFQSKQNQRIAEDNYNQALAQLILNQFTLIQSTGRLMEAVESSMK